MRQRSIFRSNDRILFFCGPSGGHLFPGIAIAQALKKKEPHVQCILITSKRAQLFNLKKWRSVFSQIHYLPEFPAPTEKWWVYIPFAFQLCAAFIQTYALLKSLRPRLVLGFGSFVTFPGIVLSHYLKIPNMIHEQNVLMGRATRWLLKYTDALTYSFPNTAIGKVSCLKQCVGLPLREEILQSPKLKKKNDGKIKLLILGGSQGARELNHRILDVFRAMSDPEKAQIAVNHITGYRDFDAISKAYQNLDIEYQIWPFYDKMEDLYRDTDVALTRAGANTLFELAYFGIPAVVVPYRHALSHQMANAKYLESWEAVRVVEETGNADELEKVLRELFSHSGKRDQMSSHIKNIVQQHAGEAFIALIPQIVSSKRSS